MRLKFSNLRRTNLGFPSEWKGKCSEDQDVVCSFRQGRLKVFSNGVLVLETWKDEWDISGYLSDEDLILLLTKNDLLDK